MRFINNLLFHQSRKTSDRALSERHQNLLTIISTPLFLTHLNKPSFHHYIPLLNCRKKTPHPRKHLRKSHQKSSHPVYQKSAQDWLLLSTILRLEFTTSNYTDHPQTPYHHEYYESVRNVLKNEMLRTRGNGSRSKATMKKLRQTIAPHDQEKTLV